MRFLEVEQILALHQNIIQQSGGSFGVRDHGGLESALGQANLTFDGQDLYPTLIDKVATTGFLLIANHPFVDGNKRIGHSVIETILVLNGLEIDASVDEQEQIILAIASGSMEREAFSKWLKNVVVPLGNAQQWANS